MPTDVFNFDYYLTDYVAQFRKYLESTGTVIGPDLDAFLKELERATDLRDTDLEDYLAVGSFAPSIGLSRLSTQSLNNATLTPIVLTAQDWESTDVLAWDGASRVTVQKSGIVSIKANLRYATNATGWRSAFIYVNGLTEIGGTEQVAYGTGQPRLPATVDYPAIEDDYIELWGYQTSGGALNIDAAKLQITWLGSSG